MTQKEIAGGLVLLAAGEGMKLHETGSDAKMVYNTKIVKASDVALYEEVPAESVPAYSRGEYEAKVAELIRQRYSADEEFALQRKMLNTLLQPMTMSDDAADKAVAEYDAYNAYAEQCKVDAPAALAREREEREQQERQQREREQREREAAAAEAAAEDGSPVTEE